jgi:hypothetical protein
MPSPFMNVAVARAAERLPGLRRLPLARLVILADVAILAKTHLDRLTPAERRRLLMLVKDAKGRPRNLSQHQRSELEGLIAKIEPKDFASQAVERLTPLGKRRR